MVILRIFPLIWLCVNDSAWLLSYDLRQKVMQAIEMDGLKKNEASELFGISRNTINLWFKRRDETGDIKVKVRASSSQQPKISNWEKFSRICQRAWR